MVAEWQRMAFARKLAEWQADELSFSSRRLRLSLNAIKGASPNAIECHKPP